MEFGESVKRNCADLASKFDPRGTVTVTYDTAREMLPHAVASQLNLIATELLASAFAAFERKRSGRIGVSFATTATSLDLMVEHSRPEPRAASCHGVAHSWLARTLVARLGGRIEHATVIGGARTMVNVQRQ